MELTQLILDLWEHGNVTVDGRIMPFTEEDRRRATDLLRQKYDEDRLEMPYNAPSFDPEAALWAASFLYHALQLALLRELDDKAVDLLLPSYTGHKTPEAVYSADLILRYLPALLSLSKGLAPADVLVTRLKALALEWPFSSAGLDLPGEPDLTLILGHPSLRAAYRDRVLEHRDKERLRHPEVASLVQEAEFTKYDLRYTI